MSTGTWEKGWREETWGQLDEKFDLVIIGGGITGAGILREAARAGLKALLLEQGDFASGTSSRSSKLVHGGLRYLKNAQIKLTYESVHEREHLLKEGCGLVMPLSFVMANFRGDKIPGWAFGIGLTVYDIMALKWNHAALNPQGMRGLIPLLSTPEVASGFRYFDAQTDDARLVLRVIQEAVAAGGLALNYTRVEGLLKSRGRVCGVALRDLAPGKGHTYEVHARVVINASGAWADEVRQMVRGRRRLRVLRGSHIFLPQETLPLTRAITFLHPADGRPVFIYPWEGVTLVGTTDVDHAPAPATDLAISREEQEYLLAAAQHVFPASGLTAADVRSTLAGIRAVVNTGRADPSKESREYVLWRERGLLTISGGKLTTFRLMAHTALRAVRGMLPRHAIPRRTMRVFDPPPAEGTLCAIPDHLRLRLLGRYGNNACNLMDAAGEGDLQPIADSLSLWAELRWAARSEGVIHLDDLLARRLRLNLTLARGGLDEMARIRRVAQPELGWDDTRWEAEEATYRQAWQDFYAPL